MALATSDQRRNHLITRGNVDGIVAAAVCLAREPATRVSFVASGDLAVDVLRKDIGSRHFQLVDLGLTPRLVKTLNDKGKTRQRITYLDHHQQSFDHWRELAPHVQGLVRQGVSAAAVAYEYWGSDPAHRNLIAVADAVEYCPTRLLADVSGIIGASRMEEEARMLDFAWRFQVDDDRFRLAAARRLAAGAWPSQVPEIRSRYISMVNEGRWERALSRVRDRVELRHDVALLNFGRHRPSLLGFGSRALTEVARELGARMAVLLNRRKKLSSISLRSTSPTARPGDLHLGLFVEEFTQRHGIVGGGHATSAGAKIPSRAVPAFLHDLYRLA